RALGSMAFSLDGRRWRSRMRAGPLELSAPLLTPRDLRAQRHQLVGPVAAEVVEPGVDLLQWRGVERVEAARAFGADGGEARVAEDLQMLAHRGLADAELGGDDLDDFARGVLLHRQQFEDAAADGIAEDVEGVHHMPGGASPE